MSVDYLKHCPSCLWCCHGEKVFVSEAEQEAMGSRAFTGKSTEGGACEKLSESTGLCTVHELRPIECRLFPLDILEIERPDGTFGPTWVVWTGPCSATTEMSKSLLDKTARGWEGRLTYGWVRAYLDHHAVNMPTKYRAARYVVLRGFENL